MKAIKDMFMDIFRKKQPVMNYKEILKLILTDTLDDSLKLFNDRDKKKLEDYRDIVISNFNLTHCQFTNIFNDLMIKNPTPREFNDAVRQLTSKFREFMYRQWAFKESTEPELKYYMTERILKNINSNNQFNRISWLIKDAKIDDVTPACYLSVHNKPVDRAVDIVYDRSYK